MRVSNSKRRTAPTTWHACPNCSTAASPSWRSSFRMPSRRRQRKRPCCATTSPRKRWPRSCPSGPASRSPRCSKAKRKNCCRWKPWFGKGWSARTRRSRSSPMQYDVRAPGCRTRADPLVRSCSSVRPASVRPSSPRRLPIFFLIPTRQWCGSTCRSSWRGTRLPDSSGRRRAMSATRRVAT